MKSFFIRFKDQIVKFVKGAAIGIAVIVPGVSGGTLAVLLNIYDDMLEAIGGITKHFKKSIFVLLPIGLGALTGAIALMYPISWGLDNYPLATATLFVGLIIGGIPSFYKKIEGHENVRDIIIGIVACALLIVLCFSTSLPEVNLLNVEWHMYPLLILIGVLAASALVLPGISGSMVLLLIGFYRPLMEIVKQCLKFENLGNNILIMIPFAIGLIAGFYLLSKLMSFALKKHATMTYFIILGLIFGSIPGIYYALYQDGMNLGATSIPEWIVAAVLLVVGIGASIAVATFGKKMASKKEEQKQIEETTPAE